MEDIDYNLFKVFLEVANAKSITGASERLFITQPAVTQAIGRLEKLLNAQLFIRQSRGVELTDYGKLIYENAQNISNNINSAILKIEKFSNYENNVIKIGCGANIANWIIRTPCKELLKQHNGIKIELVDDKKELLFDKLKNFEIDCFIAPKIPLSASDKNLQSETIKKVSFCFICGTKYKYLCDDIVKIETLQNLPFITLNKKISATYNYFDTLCKNHHLSINSTISASRFATLCDFVKDNIGISFVPEYIAKTVCDDKTLFSFKSEMDIGEIDYDIYYNKNYQSKLLTEFISKLKNQHNI